MWLAAIVLVAAQSESQNVVAEEAPDRAPAESLTDADAWPEAPRPAVAADLQVCFDIAKTSLGDARRCLRQLRRESGAVERGDVAEALRVLDRLQPHVDPRESETPEPAAAGKWDAKQFVVDGHLEAVVHGAAFGAFAGFTGAAGVLSATRTSEKDALPVLLAAPAIGLVAGAAAGLGAVSASGASADDVAFVASTMWATTALGYTLQLAVFADSTDVQAAPLRFFTTLSAGALGLAAGVGWAPFLDVSAGDAALANSGFFWGGLLTAATSLTLQSGGVVVDPAVTLMIVGGGALVSWGGLMALHPLVRLHRVSTWVIDIFGAFGVVAGGAFGIIAAVGGGGGLVGPTTFTATLALSLGVGGVTAFLVDDFAHRSLDTPPPLAFSPAFFRTRSGLAPGVVVEVARW